MLVNALVCQGQTHSDRDLFLHKARAHANLRLKLLAAALTLEARAIPRHVVLATVEFLEDSALLCRNGRPVSEVFGGEDITRSWIWVGRRRYDMNQWATHACWGCSGLPVHMAA